MPRASTSVLVPAPGMLFPSAPPSELPHSDPEGHQLCEALLTLHLTAEGNLPLRTLTSWESEFP